MTSLCECDHSKMDLVLLGISHIVRLMSVEMKNPLKRDQALNDAISGQIGEEPRPEPSSTRSIYFYS